MENMQNNQKIAAAFVKARQENLPINTYPGDMPADLDTAYAIQNIAINLMQEKVGGWKVAKLSPEFAEKFGEERLVGPVFESSILFADHQQVSAAIFDGYAAAEVEIMMRVGNVPDGKIDVDGARGMVDEVRFGLEMAGSPFAEINAHGPAVTISDFGNNNGLIIGDIIENMDGNQIKQAVININIDGELVGSGNLADGLDGPLAAAAFLHNILIDRGLSLEKGQWISTGAITGAHKIEKGAQILAKLDDKLQIAARVND
ncbi:hypothetical protein LPB140_10500 [Sphingorhabdus lutea]|uniref:2-keto-4-pentenoate hydratase n=1 Tax=Sphingorhabdus lutea TaxID=1913578 RepID=A0A1L3JDB9_9SPHN|nr:hypothetical protein [Sphingorhabdus lutea]APG63147.1 hypothetical protein LPB140_10500 [Sphingorhabdus lutea]